MGSLDTHGGFCNVCGRALNEDHIHYSHSQMQRAVRQELRPPAECPSWALSRAMGANRRKFDLEWVERISDSGT